MLFRLMGRDAGLAAQKDYMATYRDSSDHPVLQDYLAVMRRPRARSRRLRRVSCTSGSMIVVVPQYLVEDAKATLGLDGRWTVTARVKNVGTGTMPIDVAATRGERFKPTAKAAPATVPPAAAAATRRAEAWLRGRAGHAHPRRRRGEERCASGARSSRTSSSSTPDVHVLQLERKKAAVCAVACPGRKPFGRPEVRTMRAITVLVVVLGMTPGGPAAEASTPVVQRAGTRAPGR